MSNTILRGAALSARARDLGIPGRSRMSADELRAAIDAVSAPVPAQGGNLQVKIIPVNPGTPFRVRNGKRKPSIHVNRRRSR